VFGRLLFVELILSWLRQTSIRRRSSSWHNAKRWGLRWSLNLNDNLQRRLYFAHSYEAATLFQTARRMHPDDVILDVGANVGTFSLPLLRHIARRGSAVAVEPAPDARASLDLNVRQNAMASRVKIVGVALSDHAGVGRLKDSTARDTGLRSLVAAAPSFETVDVCRGDDMLGDLGCDSVDVIKIDVEGEEYAVLRGLRGLLDRGQPRILVVELLKTQGRSTESRDEIASMLRDLGYAGYWVRYRGLEEIERSPHRGGNALFIRTDFDPLQVATGVRQRQSSRSR
jgi:FkbM family methyltransferase